MHHDDIAAARSPRRRRLSNPLRDSEMPRLNDVTRGYFPALILCLVATPMLKAQGVIRGTVTEAEQRPASDAIVHVTGTALGARADSSGIYRVLRVPAGSYTIRVAKIGFIPESAVVVVRSGETATQNFVLHALVQELTGITVTSKRLGETEAAALQRQSDASNLVKVLPGDVIRALPTPTLPKPRDGCPV